MIWRHVLLILLGFLAGCSTPARDAVDEAREGALLPQITKYVVYGHKFGLAMTFDVYQPQERNGAAVIFINSGGWQSPAFDFDAPTSDGNRFLTDSEIDQADSIHREFSPRLLLESGFTVFNVRHGSSPRFEMPEIVADLRRAVRFILYRASEYGVDPERIGLWGGSAGGHLALLLGTTSEIGNVDASDDFELMPGRVAAVVVYFPVTDIQRLVRDRPVLVDWMPALDLGPEQYRGLSPIHFASPDDPPTLIIHGDQDTLIPIVEGESMHQALLASGVRSEFKVIVGAEHGFKGEDADLALAETVSWFQEHLGR